MGTKQVATWNAWDNYSIMYFWNLELEKLQAFRFDSFLIALDNSEIAEALMKKKDELQSICNYTILLLKLIYLLLYYSLN